MISLKNNFLYKNKIKKINLLFFSFLFLFFSFFIFYEADIYGILSLFSVAVFTFYFSLKYKSLANILFVALCLRITLLFFGNNFITLPDSWGDAVLFETKAWEFSQQDFFSLNFLKIYKSYFLSWILAIFYSLFDRSSLMAQSLSLFFGMSSILLSIQIANKIWNEKISIRIGWILSIYPTLVLYSCVILKEAYIWYFLLLGIYGIVCWSDDRKFKSLLISFIGFSFSTLFHGGMILGGLTFLIIITIISVVEFSEEIKSFKISLKTLFTCTLSLISIFYFFIFFDSIPKIDSMKNFLNFNFLIELIEKKNINSAAYPEWTIPTTTFELFYKSPLRIMYFIFAPFPWDVNKYEHLLGLFDSIFHIFLFGLLIINFKSIWNNKAARLILLILFTYIIVFGISVGNFGTGIRHRTKFMILFLLLVLPWISQFPLNKKKQL